MNEHSYVFASITNQGSVRYSIRLNGAQLHARDGRLRQWRTEAAAKAALAKMVQKRTA